MAWSQVRRTRLASLGTEDTFAAMSSPATILFRGSSVALDSDVFDLMAFDADSRHLLRACRADCTVKWAGRIFKGAGGNLSTYSQSFMVSNIDSFLSHNWTTPRWQKFVTLSWHLNFKVAAVIVGIFSGVVYILGASGRLPSARTVNHAAITHAFDDGMVCRMASMPLFLVALFTSRDFLSLCGVRGPTMFLDKVCIAQHDEDLKRQGILKLGAFIRCSDRLLILYTDVYLKKLWTVFEVASFLASHEVSDMTMLPISRSQLVITTVLACWVYSLLLLGLSSVPAKLNVLAGFCTIPAAFIWMWCARTWAKDRNQVKERLASFAVRDCMCACEADRPVVYTNITKLMRAIGLVAADAAEVDALTVFDQIVREKLAEAISVGLGRRMMRLPEYLLLAWGLSGAEMVDFACALGYGMPLREWLGGTFFIATWFFLWPAILIGLEELAFTKLHFARWKAMLWVCFMLSLVVIVLLFVQELTRLLCVRAVSEAWALAVQIATVTIGLVVLIVVPSTKRLCQCGGRDQVRSEDERSNPPAATANENIEQFGGGGGRTHPPSLPSMEQVVPQGPRSLAMPIFRPRAMKTASSQLEEDPPGCRPSEDENDKHVVFGRSLIGCDA